MPISAVELELARQRRGIPLGVLLHAAFVVTGIVNTILGPMLPILSERWSMSDLQAGYLFMAQFLGSMLGVAGSSMLTPRRGLRFSIVLGLLLMVVGIVALTLGNWSLGLFSTACFGTGFGLTIPSVNLAVAELNPDRRAAALNLINFSWGVGAVASPFIVAAAQGIHATSVVLFGVAGALGIVAAAIGRSQRMMGETGTQSPHAPVGQSVRSPVFALLIGIFFLYVGTEASVAGWIASFVQRMMTGAGVFWAVAPSFFWAPLLCGRAIAPIFLHKVRQEKLALAGIITAGVGVCLLLLAHHIPVVIMAVIVSGLGLSSVFPIAIAMLSLFGKAESRVAGPLFAMAGLGGATLPWLVGYVSTKSQNLRTGLSVPLLACCAMLLLWAPLARHTRPVNRDIH